MKKFLKTPISQKEVIIDTKNSENVYIMALESSCDETACAIVKNGREVISNIVASQIKTHQKFGGVVPEVAAREHLDAVNLAIEEAFTQSGLKPSEIKAFSATVGPGLVGSLLVGLNAAKTLAITYDKPFIGINHLKAHVCANYLETELKPPFIALLVSGGHTQLIKVDDFNSQQIIGETIDDAVGEAYDKVARLISLPYPGGPNLDKLAHSGNKKAYKLPQAKVGEFEFSFSGLKTAVLQLYQKLKKETENLPKEDIAASFQECVSDTLLKKALLAAEKNNLSQIVLAGGVAANSEIRNKFFDLEKNGYKVFAPPIKFCTDNAAMVASAAYFCKDTMNDLNQEVFSRVKK